MSTAINSRRKSGDRYGALELLHPVGNDGKHIAWLVKCHGCGKIYEKKSLQLRNKRTQSCGCLYKRQNSGSPNWRGVGEISSTTISHYKINAKRRGIEFLITGEYMWRLFLLQDRKCALSGLKLCFGRRGRDENTASLDRVDSSKPYQIGNVQWLHKHVNMMKLDHDQKYFIKLCKLIAK